MGEAVWLVAAVVAVVVIGFAGWWLRRSAPPARAADEGTRTSTTMPEAPAVAAAVVPPAAVAAPTVSAHGGPAPATQAPLARPAPPVVPPLPRVEPAASRAAAPQTAAPRVAVRPIAPALPKLARFELRHHGVGVLALERAGAAAWHAASALASTPVQREQLSGLLARASELDGVADGDVVYEVNIAAGAALALARSEAAAAGVVESVPPLALESTAAATFAAAALALQAARVHLPALRVQVGETKTVAAALHPKLIALTEGRLKSLVQDLARYLREAEENYAGAIRKPVFIARVDAACEQAVVVWQGALAAAAAARVQIEAQVHASRFGEAQLEKALAALRDLQGQRRVLDAAARILSGWEQLRLMLGEAAPAAAAVLQNAADQLSVALEADARIATATQACLDAAKAPDYVGKAEFNANRNAARELLAGFDAAAFAAAQAALAHATAALAAGFAGQAAQALLLRVDAAARVVEVREPATSSATG